MKDAFLEPHSLSITERHFLSLDPNKPQVIMCFMLGLKMHPAANVKVETLIDLLKVAACQHYRLCVGVTGMTTVPLSLTADKLPLQYQILNSDHHSQSSIFEREINTNFLIRSDRPLWRSTLLVKGSVVNECLFVFSFHHSLGDGLSMFAFARSFAELLSFDYLTGKKELDLTLIPVPTLPPPLMDNLINPWFIEIIPALCSLVASSIRKMRHVRYRGRNVAKIAPSESPKEDVKSESIPMQVIGQTKVSCIMYEQDFVSTLLAQCKKHSASIASVLVIAALGAVRNVLENVPQFKESKIPSRQGWVVTNSLRHLLPESKLSKGEPKETDKAMSYFGGYAGSVSRTSMKLKDYHDFWERSRSVKRTIRRNYSSSLGRLKVLNYAFRRPSFYKFLQKRVDLSAHSRTFSVEVANLAAWPCPSATINAPDTDLRARIEHFAGIMNSSFDGARGIFTLGVITLDQRMSIAVAYDSGAVSESDAAIFIQGFQRIMNAAKTQDTLKIGQARH